MGRRWVTAALGLFVSLAVSAAVYSYTGRLVAFLFVPFVPLLLGRRRSDEDTRHCPECGFRTTDEYAYCPHDGTRLE